MSRIWGDSVLVWVLALFSASLALAQGGATGAITGTVQDSTGAVVANAEVRIVNQDTGAVARTTKTDANGSFTAPLLPVGTYTVAVTSPGFQEGKSADIAVRVTETTRINLRAAPLKALQNIELHAEEQHAATTHVTPATCTQSAQIPAA